jgi:hypothetical protein
MCAPIISSKKKKIIGCRLSLLVRDSRIRMPYAAAACWVPNACRIVREFKYLEGGGWSTARGRRFNVNVHDFRHENFTNYL